MNLLLERLPTELIACRPLTQALPQPGTLLRVAAGRGALRLTGWDGPPVLAQLSSASSWTPESLAGAASIVRVAASDEELVLELHRFERTVRWQQPRTVAVDEEAVELLQRVTRLRDVTAVCEKLLDDLVLDTTPVPSLVARGEGGDPRSVTLVAADYAVDLRVVNDLLRVHSVQGFRVDARPDRLTLIEGDVAFVPASYARELDETAKSEHEGTAEPGSFRELWTRYTMEEGQARIDRASDVPVTSYVDVRPDDRGGFAFELEPCPDATKLTQILQERGTEVLEAPSRSGDALVGPCHLEETAYGPRVVMKPRPGAGEPLGQGRLAYSRRGDEISTSRRLSALEEPGRHTPQLALERLLTTGSLPEAPERRRRVEPVTESVLQVFGGRPTQAQRRALDLALNTPDIAVIQGPPGTGKTRVIAALQARIDEEHTRRRTGNDDRQVLLTGPQHDAVEHAAAASSHGRLPAIKIGSPWGDEDDHRARAAEWRRRIADRLGDDVPDDRIRDLLSVSHELDSRVQRHQLGSSPRETLELLVWISEQAAHLLTAATQADLHKLQARFERSVASFVSPDEIPTLRRIARGLRVRQVSFADDGAARCRAALESPALTQLLDTSQIELLRRLAQSDSEPGVGELAELTMLRDDVLDSCERATVQGGGVGSDVDELADSVTREIASEVAARLNPVTLAIHRFTRRLEEEPEAVTDSLLHHTSTLAATLQQSAGSQITEYQPAEKAYETVIVDEAARAVPPDLLIAVRQARTRLVLVGDHRQLPQHLEDDVLAKFDDEEVAALRPSLFQRTFDLVRELPGPVRYVTLDTQFRMHPDIGRLVDDHFYSPHGENLRDGTSGEDRPLAGLPVAAALSWHDVGADAGRERGRYHRPAEAEATVDRLLDLLDAPARPSVGVVLPYREQVTACWTVLSERGRAEMEGERGRPRHNWSAAFDDGIPRFRIGTVDSFQGREFDVVVFGATRSNVRGSVGFLSSPNRMAVALSRARSALVVVGDRAFFSQAAVGRSVPALHDLATGRAA